jgi:hypothetical protein
MKPNRLSVAGAKIKTRFLRVLVASCAISAIKVPPCQSGIGPSCRQIKLNKKTKLVLGARCPKHIAAITNRQSVYLSFTLKFTGNNFTATAP